MKTLLALLLTSFASLAMAQDFCATENLKAFQRETRLSCKNLILTDISFKGDGKNVYAIGQVARLDSLVQYLARNEYIYEIDYETKNKKTSLEEIRKLENDMRDYLISKNSVNQIKVLPEAHQKIDHSAWIPENKINSFFFVVIYPEKE